MTDGKQTVDDDHRERGVLSSDILFKAVQPLKDKKVRVIALGIGSNTNIFDLLTIASTSNDVFLAENFEQLKGLVADLAQNKCPGKKGNPFISPKVAFNTDVLRARKWIA